MTEPELPVHDEHVHPEPVEQAVEAGADDTVTVEHFEIVNLDPLLAHPLKPFKKQ